MNNYQPRAMPVRQPARQGQPQAMPMTREQEIQQMVLNGVITPEQAALMMQREAMPALAVKGAAPLPTRTRRPSTPSVFPSIGGVSAR